MALIQYRRFIAPLVFLVLMAGHVTSCEEYIGFNVDCSECYSVKPDSADLILELTIDQENPEVRIVVYRDHYEGQDVEYIDTARESPYYLFVPVHAYYSATAEYNTDQGKIKAVDGDRLKVKHVSEACDLECWIVQGGELDLTLKYNQD